MKTFEKFNESENFDDERNDPDFLAKWVYEENYEDKKRVYTNDVIEYLTGYFGIGKRFNRKSLTKIINDVFDNKLFDKPIKYDYNSKICRQMDVKKDDHTHLLGDFDDEESSIIESILEMIWNGE